MRMRKLIAGLLTLIMLFTVIPVTAFAEEDVKGDAVAIMEIENPECVEISNLKDLKLVVEMKGESEFRIEIPIEAVDLEEEGEDATLTLWLGYGEKIIEKKVLDYLSALQGDIFEDLFVFKDEAVSGIPGVAEGDGQDTKVVDVEVKEAIDQVEAVLGDIEVSIDGLPEGHYTVDQDSTGCMIVTRDIVEAVVTFIEELLAELYPDLKFDEIDGFKSLVEAVLAEEDMTLDEVITMIAEEDTELAAQIDEIFNEIDQALAYLRSEDFPGLMIAGAYLTCNCAMTEEYEILHEYYKNINGELEMVGYVYEGEPWYEGSDYCYLEGKTGDVIRSADFVNTEYEGVTYKYVGSYNMDVMYEDAYEEYDWSGYELSEYVLGSEELIDGMILRYEIEAEPDTTVSEDDGEDKAVDTTAFQNKRTTAAKTGDESDLVFYLIVLAGAATILVTNRKKYRA